MRYFAQCPANINDIVASEASGCGAEKVKLVPGGVQFRGDLETGYRFALRSRCASRLLLEIERDTSTRAEIPVFDKDSLYDAAYAISWDEHMSVDMTFSISVSAHKASWIKNTQYVAQRVKDALVDQMRHTHGSRPDVDSDNPQVAFHAHIEGKKALFYLDFSSAGMHKRGYRVHQQDAQLKEHLAAALLYRSGWREDQDSYPLLLDPFCGTGTIPIEAALIATSTAPGLLDVQRFGFHSWLGHVPSLFERILTEQKEKVRSLSSPILAWDISDQAIEESTIHANRAGVSQFIEFKTVDMMSFDTDQFADREGIIVTDPPYGVRSGDTIQAHRLYAKLGKLLPISFAGWKAHIFTGDEELLEDIRLRPSSVNILFNGPIKCALAHYDIFSTEKRLELEAKALERKKQREEAPLSDQAQMCLNRMIKNKRMLKAYLKREEVTSYRLYDADLPDYSAAVDIYENTWAHIQEYAPPKTISEETATKHLKELVDIVNRATGIEYDNIHVKQRKRQKGSDQYTKLGSKGSMFIMRENGLKFLVNFTDYLDTGIFLDHRPIRAYIKNNSRNCRFLNLFCYTGTATVHAAAGGALSTVSVDASATYLAWAEENMKVNGFSGMNHFYEKNDCIAWLKASRDKFDLIFIDPPTFSNSKSRKDIFDVQKDHYGLIKLAMRHLSPSGTIIFSNNFRKFILDRRVEEQYLVEDVTEMSIGDDFKRNTKIHSCFLIRPKRVIKVPAKKDETERPQTRKHIYKKRQQQD